MNTKKYNEAFDLALARLNNAQRQAVNTLTGPVMVIAGPGTGKTQILASRIGKILQDTDALPENILCLTYTDTGRSEMRKRLISLIGPAAYRVAIHTFHSFCNDVIQENSTYFGKLNLDLISELELVILMRKLIDEIPEGNELKRYTGEVYYDLPRLKNLFQKMKKEAWTVEYLISRINGYIELVPYMEEFKYKKKFKDNNVGDLKKEGKNEIERMKKLKDAVNLYPNFQLKMKESGRYTYDDMILWVLDAFSTNKNLLLNYQERFQYFLIDEFQDTSGSQSKLMYYLISYFDNPDVFVVGDDDQSIYSFQDANVKNIEDFRNLFKENLTKVVLEENYRSTQIILDLAKTLITNNKERIEQNKVLHAKSERLKEVIIIPEIIEYSSSAHETVGIALKIEQLIKDGIEPKEIAVLYRNHNNVSDLDQYLRNSNIPVYLVRSSNLLKFSLIEQIINIIRFVALELAVPFSGDAVLFQILHFPFFNLRPIDIARLALKTTQKNFDRGKETYSLRIAIGEQLPAQTATLFDQPDSADMKRVSLILEKLISDAASSTLQQFFENLLYQTGILNFSLTAGDKYTSLQLINSFFNYLKDETQKDNMDIQAFVHNLDLLQSNNISIPFYKMAGDEKGVQLMTAHGSKGAEFEHVFIINCTKSNWGEKKNNNSAFKLPDNLVSIISQHTTNPLEEERRLFYVAITRAKTNLTISYFAKDEKEKDHERSQFVEEIINNDNFFHKTLTEMEMVNFYATRFQQNEPPRIKLIDKDYIDTLLKNYTLSVTHLNTYLNCPLSFYFQNLIKVPAAKSAAMTFGSAVHHALQRLFEKMDKSDDKIFPSKKEFVDDFNWYLHRNVQSFTKEEFKLRKEYGAKILPAYYDSKINNWSKNILIEKNIKGVEIQGVPINGKLDKIEISGNFATVVDYKTGKYDNAKKKISSPNDKDVNGGDYWRQAVFYKILMDNFRGNDKMVISSVFDFVEPYKDAYEILKVDVSAEDVSIVTQQIVSTWEKIKNHEFDVGCNDVKCQWCNFVKKNALDVNRQGASYQEDWEEE